MITYKGVNIPEEIIIVEKLPIAANEEEHDRSDSINQGYVVLPGNEKMLATAKEWSRSFCYLTDEFGEYVFEDNKNGYKTVEKEGIIHTYKNGTFKFTVKDSAHGSSQGGKLSFWNCLIEDPDGKQFLIGINAELLLNLFKFSSFVNGTCQEQVYLGRIGQQVGVFTENMPDYVQARMDEKFKTLKPTIKYVPGDILMSKKDMVIYLGEYTEYFSQQPLYDVVENRRTYGSTKEAVPHNWALVVDNPPITRHCYLILVDAEIQNCSLDTLLQPKCLRHSYVSKEKKRYSRVVVGHVKDFEYIGQIPYLNWAIASLEAQIAYKDIKVKSISAQFDSWLEKHSLTADSEEAKKSYIYSQLRSAKRDVVEYKAAKQQKLWQLILNLNIDSIQDIKAWLLERFELFTEEYPEEPFRDRGGKIIKVSTIEEHLEYLKQINLQIDSKYIYSDDRARLTYDRSAFYPRV